MKKSIITSTIWKIFNKSFKKNLNVLDVKKEDENKVIKEAKLQYEKIIDIITPFGKHDILLPNILVGAILASIYLSLEEKKDVKIVEEYFRCVMNDSRVMNVLLGLTNNFSSSYQMWLKREAKKSQKSDNPYTWRFKFIKGDSLDNFICEYDKCGICYLYNKLGIEDITPALCSYDYEMAKHTNTIFKRSNTLASGKNICDCHYIKNNKKGK